MPVEPRLRLPVEHPAIRSTLQTELREVTEKAKRGWYGDPRRIQGIFRQEGLQLQHTLRTGEVTPTAAKILYYKIGMPKLDRHLGTRMDEELKRKFDLPPGVAAQVKGALLQHELDAGRLLRPEHGTAEGRDYEFRKKVLPDFVRKITASGAKKLSEKEFKQAIRLFVRKENNRAGAPMVREEEHKDRRGVRPRQLLREEIAKALLQMKRRAPPESTHEQARA